MDYCDHCQGQRFDRAQVLRALRQLRKDLRRQRRGRKVDEAVALALEIVAALDLPHFDIESQSDEIVH